MPPDVLGLLLPTFSGSRDEFGQEYVPPLSFDRVNEGRPSASTSPLFRIPLEILNLINLHVPSSSLASFALVNRDCRQLARSRQFTSVRFDYSDASLDLLKLLEMEVRERAAHNGATRNPSLGVCIRRITVATDPGWVSHRHQISVGQRFANLNVDVRDQRIAAAGEAFFGAYLPGIQSLLRSRIDLPHLELLDWEDKIVLSKSFLDDLASSSIQHLKLFRVSIDKEFELAPVNSLISQGLALRTLHLEVIWSMLARKTGGTGPLCASILRLCAPTLESLTWDGTVYFPEDLQTFTNGAWELPAFPRLRYLRLGEVELHDSSVLEAFIHEGLVALEVDIATSLIHDTFFKTRGNVASLETFVWDTIKIHKEDQSLDFLEANPQLWFLSIRGAMPTALLEKRVLPLLSESFSRLTSLSLRWESNHISTWALKNISSLRSLQQIHLTAGNRSGSGVNWKIDHKTLRKSLHKLPTLRKIAFSADSYKGPHPQSQVEDYYDTAELTAFDPAFLMLSPAKRKVHWEQQHLQRMLTEANKYFRMMGNLEWLYLGQIPMGFENDLGTKGRLAVPLSDGRNSCWTLLREMFG